MGWRKFLRREKWDRERSDELESYLQIEIDENIERGLAYDEARAAAHRKLGNSTRNGAQIVGNDDLRLGGVEQVCKDARERILRCDMTTI